MALLSAAASIGYMAPMPMQAPALNVQMTAIRPGDIGTTKPLGVWDPLNLMTTMPDKYRRWQEMEIKHGRFSMLACVHVFLTTAGIRWPGYLSFAEDIKFSDMPGGTIASWAALPNLSWIQIILVIALLDNSVVKQDPSKAPGDVADGTYVQPGSIWVRYEDVPGFTGKSWKLNAERNNGRAAMMGIIGCMIHEGLTGNPVWPIPIPPQPVLELAGDDVEKGPGRVGAFVLASLGMTFLGAISAVPEFGDEFEKQ
jgi:light-harvesting complex I chlorophyll a/b binding protein 1